MTWPRPFQGWFVILGLALATINRPTKFDVCLHPLWRCERDTKVLSQSPVWDGFSETVVVIATDAVSVRTSSSKRLHHSGSQHHHWWGTRCSRQQEIIHWDLSINVTWHSQHWAAESTQASQAQAVLTACLCVCVSACVCRCLCEWMEINRRSRSLAALVLFSFWVSEIVNTRHTHYIRSHVDEIWRHLTHVISYYASQH